MQSPDLRRALADSFSEVLENMFFTGALGDAELPAEPGPALTARVSFRGSPPGIFGVRVPVPTGRSLATAFLGVEEEEARNRAGEVVCELANMLCGSVLSRIECSARFDLGPPELDLQPAAPPVDAVRRCFEIPEGVIDVWVLLEKNREFQSCRPNGSGV